MDTPSPTPPGPHERTLIRRDVFWQNVVRDILLALAAAATSGGRLSSDAKGAAEGPDPVGDLFDGRLAVVTVLGQRIPIADVYPLFACSLPGSPTDRNTSTDVQTTVFRIKTPAGEAYTLPLSQIATFHSLSAELVAKLERVAAKQAREGGRETSEDHPFGFAAFTSLAQDETSDNA